MKLFLLRSFIFGMIAFTSAVYFKCDFIYYNKWMVNAQNSSSKVQQYIYECLVKEGKIEVENDRLVTNVTDIHIYANSKEIVKSFHIYEQKMVYMPKGLEKFLKNLIILDFCNTGLKTVHKEDLQPFPELKYLSFMSNNLEIIDFDLFIYNSKLELLLLGDNKIKVVNDALNDLPNLRFLTFGNNPCYSGEAKDNRNAVVALIKKIHNQCEIDYKEAFKQCSRDFLDCKKNYNHKA